MYRVLVAVDEESERANRLADAAASLATVVDTFEVVVVHVFRDLTVPPQVSIHQPTDDYEQLLDNLREAPATIQQVADRLEDAGADVEVRVTEGDPAQRIIELAAEEGVDNIYISGRKRSPTGKVLFGSVTQAVLLNADVPVTVTGLE